MITNISTSLIITTKKYEIIGVFKKDYLND